MRRAQVLLRDDQIAALQRVERETGRKRSELIREGVDLAIKAAERAPSDDWRQAWGRVAGIWSDRNDLDQLYAEIRQRNRDRMNRLLPE